MGSAQRGCQLCVGGVSLWGSGIALSRDMTVGALGLYADEAYLKQKKRGPNLFVSVNFLPFSGDGRAYFFQNSHPILHLLILLFH